MTAQSTQKFKISGMDCAEEVAILKRAVGPLVGGEDNLTLVPDALATERFSFSQWRKSSRLAAENAVKTPSKDAPGPGRHDDSESGKRPASGPPGGDKAEGIEMRSELR